MLTASAYHQFCPVMKDEIFLKLTTRQKRQANVFTKSTWIRTLAVTLFLNAAILLHRSMPLVQSILNSHISPIVWPTATPHCWQPFSTTAVGAECRRQVDYENEAVNTHHTSPATITLAARMTHSDFQAGQWSHAAWSCTILSVRYVSDLWNEDSLMTVWSTDNKLKQRQVKTVTANQQPKCQVETVTGQNGKRQNSNKSNHVCVCLRGPQWGKLLSNYTICCIRTMC